MVLTSLLFFAVAVAVMVKSGEWLVRSLTRIATLLSIKEFVIGFILMAFSTTLPELFVGITSAINKEPSLSLGNVVGSNIVNVSLVIGLAALLGKGMKVDLKTVRDDLHYMLLIAAVPVLLLLDGVLSRVDGVLLLGMFAFYLLRQMHQVRFFTRHISADGRALSLFETARVLARSFLFFIFSLLLLFASAHFVVKFATSMSIDLGLPTILIGLVVVAIGTSLPELTFSIRAVLAKEGSMALGDIVGAVVINSTLVLGITALINPVTAPLTLFFTSSVFMLLVLFMFVAFAESKNRISTMQGVALIFSYIVFLLVQFYLEATV